MGLVLVMRDVPEVRCVGDVLMVREAGRSGRFRVVYIEAWSSERNFFLSFFLLFCHCFLSVNRCFLPVSHCFLVQTEILNTHLLVNLACFSTRQMFE